METVAVIFGGRSVEHEVSVVTALQVMENLDRDRFTPLPVYIAKTGVWYSSPAMLNIDAFRKERLAQTLAEADLVHWLPVPGGVVRLVPQQGERRGWFGARRAEAREVKVACAIPAAHGTYGEDGSLQGFLELADVPYTSAGVVGSAVGMDKIVMKKVFAAAGIPIVPYEWFTREAWQNDPDGVVAQVEARLTYPMFVKPSNLGSSVGITRADDASQLRRGIEIAAHYDERILVEQGVDQAVEVNVSVLGDEYTCRPSWIERPVSWESFLTYEDKYIRGNFNKGQGVAREIPANIPARVAEQVAAFAVQAFRAVHARGVVRVDFLISREEQVYVNEINTIPGSFAFYLWEPAGLSYRDLLSELIEIAKRSHRRRAQNMTTFDTDLLDRFGGQKLSLRK
ncbi:D-alanine--D-alanine ligase [Alicyclobacillus cellulosilyticus]|uniref:D-alanine--D-alanine ligase n=1 Tax=Alicyclobacillus cellulosilyticus TaxID=1003997 RepID=A0A917K090_9BACL|nr:D-alanine--D-alanine ligase family protein [Alicyclobacillus cellulosilyticus]GGI95764.1 D-alanine--D-alanine ligase [Alicyclobacillus cellulosilyticus]